MATPTATEAVQVFEASPGAVSRNVTPAVTSETMSVLVHVWDQGGETGLHSHFASDATWIVLQGQVTFYGEGDAVIARLEHGGGLYIPRHTKYWFESTGAEKLVMVRCAARDKGVGRDRVNAVPEGADATG
jgi:mannose-6-phosphate isomerase-like protein (cupin superfamily)